MEIKKLEYDKILNKLSTFCDTSVGKELALKLIPSNNVEAVKNYLAETEQAVNLIYRASTPSIYNFENINKYTKVLKSDGILSIKSLLELNKS